MGAHLVVRQPPAGGVVLDGHPVPVLRRALRGKVASWKEVLVDRCGEGGPAILTTGPGWYPPQIHLVFFSANFLEVILGPF